MSEALQDDFEIDSEDVIEKTVEKVEEPKAEEPEVVEEKQPSGWIDFDALEQKAGKDEAEAIRRRVGEDFRHRKESESKIKQLERELEEIKRKEFEQSKPSAIDPPTQDDFLEDPDAAQRKQQEWADSQRKLSDWERQQKDKEAERERVQREAQAEIERAYLERAKNAKVDQAQLEYADKVVGGALSVSNSGADIADFLLKHDFGPQLVAKLATDQVAMMEVASLSMPEAVVKLDRMSDQFKRKTKSSAPPPDDPIKSTGAIPKDEDLEGFTFE